MLEFATIVPWLATAPAPETDLRAPSRTPAARRRGRTGEALFTALTEEWQSSADLYKKIGTDITINAVHCQLRKMHVKGEIERLETGTKLFKSGVYWRKKQC